MVLSPKAKVSSRERVEQLLVSKGLWNVYGLKDEINSVFCFSNHDAFNRGIPHENEILNFLK